MMNIADTLESIEKLQHKAGELAMKLIEYEARRLLAEYPNLIHEYIQAMGAAFFLDSNNEVIETEDHKELQEFNDLLIELNTAIEGIFGNPMRFTATSEVKRQW